MMQAPGLVRMEDAPSWLPDVQIILETGWTEQEYDDTSLETKRRLMTYMRARSRAEDQMRRKAEIRRKTGR